MSLKLASMAEDKLRRQEYYRKFYTDLNDMRIEIGLPPKKYHLDLLEDEVFTRTIFIKIHNGFYAVSCKELTQVFSRFGVLDDVVQFNRGHGFHSKICFNSKESTMRAFEFLNGRNIYDDCCTLELFLVQENFDAQMNAVVGQTGTEFQDRPNDKEIVVDSLKVEDFVDELEKADFGPIKEELQRNTEAKQSIKEVDGDSSSLHIQYEPSRNDLKKPMIPEIVEETWKVNSHPLKVLAVEVKDTSEVAAESIAPMGIRGTDLEINSIEFLKSPIAQDLFVEMPEPCVFQVEPTKCSNVIESPLIVDVMVHEHRLWAENLVFDPGIVDRHDLIHRDFTLFVLVSVGNETNVILLSQNRSNWVFDPGGAFALLASEPKLMSNEIEATMVAEVTSIRKHFCTDEESEVCC